MNVVTLCSGEQVMKGVQKLMMAPYPEKLYYTDKEQAK